MILRFDVQASLPETRLLLSAQTALLSSSFSVFIVLGIYNFASALQLGIFLSIDSIQPQTKTKTLYLERQNSTQASWESQVLKPKILQTRKTFGTTSKDLESVEFSVLNQSHWTNHFFIELYGHSLMFFSYYPASNKSN